MPTRDDVRQAKYDLEDAGMHYSPKNVRQRLGDHGSYRDIIRFMREIAAEAPRPRPRPPNGTHATLPPPPRPPVSAPPQAPTPAPAPAPAATPAPQDERAHREYCLGLARQRVAALEAEREQLRARASWAFRTDEVHAFNRHIVSVDRALEAARRDEAQFLGELSRVAAHGQQ